MNLADFNSQNKL